MIIALYCLNDLIEYCDVDVSSVEVLVESLRMWKMGEEGGEGKSWSIYALS
jgi:hypothetical protein